MAFILIHTSISHIEMHGRASLHQIPLLGGVRVGLFLFHACPRRSVGTRRRNVKSAANSLHMQIICLT
ncbi:hypothetical protein KsCSTR_30600 [Candidatus Kuenenia stuttgartiensis]|uniref:Uncharacterized protein n=1 Tax=Kuenenia stuttgartiensis TaxID=174633 RepID=Q1Q5F5_KUEST|nr:hypothetical protein KsCSTR_30600 [Candidatus Kuenenia stuttgartiensis]CAJ75245.1 unknown protein [Candidatus Kuenenia stuttgartiensis]